MNDKDFKVNTGEVKNVCENCRYHIFGRSCYLAHGWGYDDKGTAIVCNRKVLTTVKTDDIINS